MHLIYSPIFKPPPYVRFLFIHFLFKRATGYSAPVPVQLNRASCGVQLSIQQTSKIQVPAEFLIANDFDRIRVGASFYLDLNSVNK